jgi:hypothetical protein
LSEVLTARQKSGLRALDDQSVSVVDSLVESRSAAITDRRSLLWAWALILLLGAIDWYWAGRNGWVFVGWPRMIVSVTLLLGIGLYYGFSERNSELADAGHYAAAWIAFALAGAVFTYLTATLRMPLRDADLMRLDAIFGFDWFVWSRWVAAHHLLRNVLEAAYNTFLLQIVGSVLYLAHVRRNERNNELLWAGMISLIITALISGFFPAMAPYFPGPPDACTVALIGLRKGTVSRFVFSDLQGIIAIPSFHCVMAFVLIYTHRPPVRSFYPILILNLLMLFSTPSQGHHYLVDLIAGGAVAVLSIVAVRVAIKRFQPADRDGWR